MTVNAAFFCTLARRKLEREFRFRAASVDPERTTSVPVADTTDTVPVPAAAVS